MKQSLQLKVIILIVSLMLAVMATIIPISINRQRNDLLEAARSTLSVNTDMLNLVIKNIMLSGEAPIAVDTMESLQQIGEFKAIAIYRDNGERAFQDYKTLDFVNNYQNYFMFERTNRVAPAMAQNPAFTQVASTGRSITQELTEEKEMEYYFPLRNEKSCWECHGNVSDSGPIRGIAHFKISIAGIYRQITTASIILTSVLATVVCIFAVLLIFFIRRLVLQPLLHIGHTVRLFGDGELDSKVVVKSKDELGILGERINEMFSSVQERLRLAKYVSRSTDAMIRRKSESDLGQKNEMVILFSDVRGFTRFADQADPQVVVDHLNQLLEVQSEVVERFQGDIDKFMGDAVMAQFSDPLSAVRAGVEMVRSVHHLTKEWDYPLHIGVGINYGEVVAGNIGSQRRMEFAVIGDTVNLASRLCGIAPQNSVLISESLYTILADQLEVKVIKDQPIKGKAELVTYYAVQKILAKKS